MISLAMECERKNSNVDEISFNSRLTVHLTTKMVELRMKEGRASVFLSFLYLFCILYKLYSILLYNYYIFKL